MEKRVQHFEAKIKLNENYYDGGVSYGSFARHHSSSMSNDVDA